MSDTRTARFVRYTGLGLLLAVLFLLQSGVDLLPRVFSVAAAPVVPAVVCIALLEGETAGACFGFASGVLMDAFSAHATGFHTLFLFVLGCLCGLLGHYLLTGGFGAGFLLCAAGVLLYHVLYFLIFYLFRGFSAAPFYFVRYTLPAAAYTLVTSVPIYFIVRAAAPRCRP